jgi:hypothetical protein
MMAMKWSWAAVAMMLVGCSSGQPITIVVMPGETPHEDAGTGTGATLDDAGVDAEDAADAAPVDPPTWKITGADEKALKIVYAQKYGADTIEVAFSPVAADAEGNRFVLTFQRADGGTAFGYVATDIRAHPYCTERALRSTGADVGSPLVIEADGRISGGPIAIHFFEDSIATFHALPVVAAEYDPTCTP